VLDVPDDFATATHDPDIAGATRELMRGAVCYHTHVGWIRRVQSEPCRTILDPETAVRSAAAAGMRAILLRDLYCNSAGMAAILQPHVPEIQILGGIFLNSEIGGVNPYAVDTAITYGNGAKFVCLATDSAARGAMMNGVSAAEIAAEPMRYVTPFVDGVLKPEMYKVLEIVAENEILIETGTLSPEEILVFIKEAKRVGVDRVVVTHPSPGFVGMTIEQQVQAADLGAFIEYAWIFYTHHGSFRGRRYPRADGGRLPTLEVGSAFDEITAVGAERCILSTDLGQLDQPLPVEGLREFIFCLLELGMPTRDIAKMVRDNPSYLLGLDD
jgi:hypothetical protein